MINIVGLGCGSIYDLTVRTLKMLKESKNVFTKNKGYSIINQLESEGIEFKDYSELVNNIKKYRETKENAIYVVLGNPTEDDGFIVECKAKEIEYKLYENFEAKDFVERCTGEKIGRIIVLNSSDVIKNKINKRKNLIITDLKDDKVIGKVKMELLKVYYEDTYIHHLKMGQYHDFGKYRISDIDKIQGIDEQSVFYIKEGSRCKKDIWDLIEIIEILRSENGCPWDKEQTHQSIKKDIIEESYEVFDAIEINDTKALIEELGDVLFQVLFHTSIGNDENKFSFLDVTDGISNKMIYRHPHVFGNINVDSTEEVLVNWDELKKNEKNFKSLTDELNGIAKALPAMIRAKKVQKKVKNVGFDWDDISEVFDKVKEELNEVMDVYKSEKVSRIKEEIGDLLFSCVNVSRFLDVDPEEALNLTTDKFIKRFSYIEIKAKEMHKKLDEMSLVDMDKLWDEAKILEKR